MRYPNQLSINAIVSVFLRQLEYYNGILFLTTNRVGDIDPAFKSRVHVTLEYKPLNRKTTLEIYRLHLRKVLEDFADRQDVRAKVKEREILDWAEEHYNDSRKKHRQWNGRYVINMFEMYSADIQIGKFTMLSKQLSHSLNGTAERLMPTKVQR